MEKYCIEFVAVKEEPQDLLQENSSNDDFSNFKIKEEPLFGEEKPDIEIDSKEFSTELTSVMPEVQPGNSSRDASSDGSSALQRYGKGYLKKMATRKAKKGESTIDCEEFIHSNDDDTIHEVEEIQSSVDGEEKSFKCCSCGNSFMSTDRQISLTHQEEKPSVNIRCEECCNLNRKIRKNTVYRPFKCNLWKKSFTFSSDLRGHQLIQHDAMLFYCKLCPRSFKNHSFLYQHYRCHTREKPFKCGKCGKCYSSCSELLQHDMSHSEEKPFQCCACEKSFPSRYRLLQHRMTHTGERPFKCDICGNCFANNLSLKSHMGIHKEKLYNCRYCEKSFAFSFQLQKHCLVHTDEKPPRCPHCGKEFFDRKDLFAHVQSHGKQFITKETLQACLRKTCLLGKKKTT